VQEKLSHFGIDYHPNDADDTDSLKGDEEGSREMFVS
jgi:hypothetical protein